MAMHITTTKIATRDTTVFAVAKVAVDVVVAVVVVDAAAAVVVFVVDSTLSALAALSSLLDVFRLL